MERDILVGGVAIALGLGLAAAAWLDWEWYFQLAKPRWLVARLGRRAARTIIFAIGIGLVVLGSVIASGMLERLRGGRQADGTSTRPRAAAAELAACEAAIEQCRTPLV